MKSEVQRPSVNGAKLVVLLVYHVFACMVSVALEEGGGGGREST